MCTYAGVLLMMCAGIRAVLIVGCAAGRRKWTSGSAAQSIQPVRLLLRLLRMKSKPQLPRITELPMLLLSRRTHTHAFATLSAQVKLDLAATIRQYFQTSLVRKYLNYDEASREKVCARTGGFERGALSSSTAVTSLVVGVSPLGAVSPTAVKWFR